MIELKYPLTAQVELTGNCNHKCIYCYNMWQVNSPSKDYMSEETAVKLVDKIVNEIKPFNLILTGGEPFLNYKVLKLFAEKMSKYDIGININTNLTLANSGRIEELLSVNKNFSILTSLPHFKKDEYNFITHGDINKFYDNFSNILENTNIPISVNMVVSKYNLGSIYEEGKFLHKEYGINKFTVTPESTPAITPKEGNRDLDEKDIITLYNQVKKLENEFGLKIESIQTIPLCFIPEEIRTDSIKLFNRPCTTGKSTIAISYNGNVRPCIQAPISAGNIFEKHFEEIWKDFGSFRKQKNLPEECLECLVLEYCNGGCRFNGYNEGEPLNRKDPRMKGALLTSIPKEMKKISLDINYSINNNIKYRHEYDDVYIFSNEYFNLIPVNNSLKNFILNIKTLGVFNPEKLIDNYLGDKDKLKNIFLNLIANDFLKKIE